MNSFFDTTPVNQTFEMPSDYANKTLSWYNTDSNIAYAKNKPKNYGPDDISYVFNSHGFRSDSFEQASDNGVLFVGCSFTQGVGLRLEETWSHQLLNLIKRDTGLNIPYWNLGMSGAGFDTISRLLYHYVPMLKPKLVVALLPHHFRREVTGPHGLLPWGSLFQQNVPAKENQILIDKQWSIYQAERGCALIDMVVRMNNSSLLWSSWDPVIKDYGHTIEQLPAFNVKSNADMFRDRIDAARDIMHPGPQTNSNFANALYSEYKDFICNTVK